eukprot:maker-scaffold_9-snap-gene-5.16-mRNA-1 protein AED:0.00 eAED:0.00 QI:342/1/1/1/1/1/3/1149/154
MSLIKLISSNPRLSLAVALACIVAYVRFKKTKNLSLSSNPTTNEKTEIKATEPTSSTQDPFSQLKTLKIPKIGDGTDLAEDYAGAVKAMGEKLHKQGGVGYIDMYGYPTLMVTEAPLIRKLMVLNVQHALWGGLSEASKNFFGKNVLFVVEGEH